MTHHDYTRALEAVPDPDKYTHGNRIMVELKFDDMRTIYHALEAMQDTAGAGEAPGDVSMWLDASKFVWKDFSTAPKTVKSFIAAGWQELIVDGVDKSYWRVGECRWEGGDNYNWYSCKPLYWMEYPAFEGLPNPHAGQAAPQGDLEALKKAVADMPSSYPVGSGMDGEITRERLKLIDHLAATGHLHPRKPDVSEIVGLDEAIEETEDFHTDYMPVFKNVIAASNNHEGDCTKQPFTCFVCCVINVEENLNKHWPKVIEAARRYQSGQTAHTDADVEAIEKALVDLDYLENWSGSHGVITDRYSNVRKALTQRMQKAGRNV